MSRSVSMDNSDVTGFEFLDWKLAGMQGNNKLSVWMMQRNLMNG